MGSFIDSIIKLLLRLIIILFLIFICFIGYALFFSKTNELSLKDSFYYIMPFASESSNITLSDKNSINFNINTNTISYSNSTSSSKSINFYYAQLDNTSKIIYDSLESNINNLKTDNFIIDFSTKFNTLLNKENGQETLNCCFQSALDAFFYDHPELFYIDLTKITLSIKYTAIGSKKFYKVSIIPCNNSNYLTDEFSSKEKVDEAITKVENIKNNFISKNISSSLNDYNKALKVHDALVNTLDYDSSGANSHNLYGAMVEERVVCEGYAKAFKYILDSLNIECILVSGNATSSSGETESHMWNYIKLDGNWYGVDVTWDDPIIIGGISKNSLRHTYFCKGIDTFSRSHFISNKITENGMSFNYPTLNFKDYK